MLVEVGEHLLAPLQAGVGEEDYGYLLAPQVRTLFVRLAYGRMPVLAVVYQYGGVYGYAEHPYFGVFAKAGNRKE